MAAMTSIHKNERLYDLRRVLRAKLSEVKALVSVSERPRGQILESAAELLLLGRAAAGKRDLCPVVLADRI